MLEHDTLLLQPWDLFKKPVPRVDREDRAPTPRWAILEPNAGALVGLVRPRPNTQSFWTRWFGRAQLAVYESDDEPLVCTLLRGWGPGSAWELRDADGHMVGRITKSHLQGPLGRYPIHVKRPKPTVVGFHDSQGRALAGLTRQGNDWILSFEGACKGDPFARMLILGAALVANPTDLR
jgi:hypothetical protein